MRLWRGEDMAALLASATGASAPGDAADQARRLLAEGGYQSSLPSAPAPVAPGPLSLSLGPMESLVRALLWAALAVAVALLAAWLWRRLSRGVKDAAEAAPEVLPVLAVPFAGAEALAAAGRFAEAIHSLLLETLAALSRAAQLAPSHTSREVARPHPAAGRAREALAGLVLRGRGLALRRRRRRARPTTAPAWSGSTPSSRPTGSGGPRAGAAA